MPSVLHFSFNGEYVLIPTLHLDSWLGFLASAFFSIVVCLLERLATALADDSWTPAFLGSAPWQFALWRSTLYWITTFLRLTYMIIAMSQNAALLLIVVTTLSAAQFFKELRRLSRDDREKFSNSHYVELAENQSLMSIPSSVNDTRPRSRSKPELSLHPMQSNLARADAAASQMGLGDTERVRGNHYDREEAPWEAGAGKNAARRAFGGAETEPFNVGDDSDSEST